uniref:FTH domain-containing protein n=1 Tax=Caenorhabditis tropicalis TaxID=1561998 RepID=A0A1I7UV48_9PELO
MFESVERGEEVNGFPTKMSRRQVMLNAFVSVYKYSEIHEDTLKHSFNDLKVTIDHKKVKIHLKSATKTVEFEFRPEENGCSIWIDNKNRFVKGITYETMAANEFITIVEEALFPFESMTFDTEDSDLAELQPYFNQKISKYFVENFKLVPVKDISMKFFLSSKGETIYPFDFRTLSPNIPAFGKAPRSLKVEIDRRIRNFSINDFGLPNTGQWRNLSTLDMIYEDFIPSEVNISHFETVRIYQLNVDEVWGIKENLDMYIDQEKSDNHSYEFEKLEIQTADEFPVELMRQSFEQRDFIEKIEENLYEVYSNYLSTWISIDLRDPYKVVFGPKKSEQKGCVPEPFKTHEEFLMTCAIYEYLKTEKNAQLAYRNLSKLMISLDKKHMEWVILAKESSNQASSEKLERPIILEKIDFLKILESRTHDYIDCIREGAVFTIFDGLRRNQIVKTLITEKKYRHLVWGSALPFISSHSVLANDRFAHQFDYLKVVIDDSKIKIHLKTGPTKVNFEFWEGENGCWIWNDSMMEFHEKLSYDKLAHIELKRIVNTRIDLFESVDFDVEGRTKWSSNEDDRRFDFIEMLRIKFGVIRTRRFSTKWFLANQTLHSPLQIYGVSEEVLEAIKIRVLSEEWLTVQQLDQLKENLEALTTTRQYQKATELDVQDPSLQFYFPDITQFEIIRIWNLSVDFARYIVNQIGVIVETQMRQHPNTAYTFRILIHMNNQMSQADRQAVFLAPVEENVYIKYYERIGKRYVFYFQDEKILRIYEHHNPQ